MCSEAHTPISARLGKEDLLFPNPENPTCKGNTTQTVPLLSPNMLSIRYRHNCFLVAYSIVTAHRVQGKETKSRHAKVEAEPEGVSPRGCFGADNLKGDTHVIHTPNWPRPGNQGRLLIGLKRRCASDPLSLEPPKFELTRQLLGVVMKR